MSNLPAPLGREFRVLVVPVATTSLNVETFPTTVHPRGVELIPVAAHAARTSLGVSEWAFEGDSKVNVIEQLRELADYLESCPRDGNRLNRF